jgi:hypothetical protein
VLVFRWELFWKTLVAQCVVSERMQVYPRHIHNMKINMPPPGSNKQCAALLKRRRKVFWTTPWQETHLAQTHFRKTETTRNQPHQNVLVTRTQVKTLYKEQTSLIQSNTETNLDLRNTALGHDFHIQHRNFVTFAVEDLSHDSGRALVRVEYGYPKGSPNTNSWRRNRTLQFSIQCPPQRTLKWPNSKPHGATRQ